MSSANHGMPVTISLLPVSLGLVHIPRSRLAQLSHPILRQILEPAPAFLNVTCNEIELSLIAEHHLLADFEPIARRDRQRQRSRSGSGSSRKRAAHATAGAGVEEPVEISYERWSVLQIDSHSDRLDNSGARVHELSAPLAAAGISILYQSSYMSDFIFVKETRLQEVMSLLGSAGFDLYSSDPSELTSRIVSPVLSPTTADDASSILELGSDFTPEAGAVLTRTRSNTDPSLSSLSVAIKQLGAKSEEPVAEDVSPRRQTPSRSDSHSPTSGEVVVLGPDLTSVGLSDDDSEIWGLKIVKLVAFPELVPSTPAHVSSRSTTRAAEPFSALAAFSSRGRLQSPSTLSSASSDADADEDGYFSHSPPGNLSATSLPSSASRSYPDLSKPVPSFTPAFKPTSKRLIEPLSPLEVPPRPALAHLDTLTPPARPRGVVPFFSFTRTPEGSSLTTDVQVLAALFAPAERHMVICGGELDAFDDTAREDAEDTGEDEEGEGLHDGHGSTLKCLQIDLRRFGLDKHGLVNRFSRVLGESGINHMYSSTFKTANLLVDKRQATRAQALLRSC